MSIPPPHATSPGDPADELADAPEGRLKLFVYCLMMGPEGLSGALGDRKTGTLRLRPARLSGWRRIWNVYHPDWKGATLNVEPRPEATVVGVLIEPIQGESGIIIPPDGYLRGIADLCREKKALFIADEIQSGLGRTGKFFAFEHEEIKPDIVIIGKALAGTVDVQQFVDQAEIDPIYFKKSYYLAPEKGGVKAYKILLNSLNAENKVGVAKVAIREREYVATLRAEDDVLVLETMWWPDEVREPAFETLEEEVEPSKEEMKMAGMIIDNLTATFDPTMWNDASREAVEAMAQAKVDGQEIVAPESPEPTKVVDLLDALKASVEATQAKKKAG